MFELKRVVMLSSFVSVLLASTPALAEGKRSAVELVQRTNMMLHLNIDPSLPEAQKDPLIGFNRKMFAFNDFLDRNLLFPVSNVYYKVVPSPINKGVTNFFRNIKEPWSAVNLLLQGHPVESGKSLARFALNTMTSLGFYDLAKQQGLITNREDFGQTLAVWGVPSGPFVMWPIIGPSTFRDTLGTTADMLTSPINDVKRTSVYYGTFGVQIVDLRADLIPYEKVLQGDKYALVRDFWLQARQSDITNGKMVEVAPMDDSFGDVDDAETDSSSDDSYIHHDEDIPKPMDSTSASEAPASALERLPDEATTDQQATKQIVSSVQEKVTEPMQPLISPLDVPKVDVPKLEGSKVDIAL